MADVVAVIKMDAYIYGVLIFYECLLFRFYLTTNNDYSQHQSSAACRQLAQSVLKIVSTLAERVDRGEVGGCTTLGDSAWRLFQLAIENAWPALDGQFFCSVENTPSTL